MDKHDLSYSCVEDLLKLFAVAVPNFSVYTLLNKFVNFKESTRIRADRTARVGQVLTQAIF